MAARTLPQFLLDPGRRAALVAIVVWGAAVQPAVSKAFAQTEDAPVLSASPAAPAVPEALQITHVRALDPKAATLLRDGPVQSATIRRLVDALDQSTVFVFVETGFLAAPSQLTVTGACPAGRLLRITLSVPEAHDRLLAWLGHELQHATEIASAPEVRSAATLCRFYRRHGLLGSGEGQCTTAAQKVTALVRTEVGAWRCPRR